MSIDIFIQRFHNLIAQRIRHGQMKLESEDVKKITSEASQYIVGVVLDKEAAPNEKKKALNLLVAISKAEDDLTNNI